MQKTKLGISVGLLGTAIFLVGLLNSYPAAIILTGYVLLFEENMWLKKSSVKAVALMLAFSLLHAVIGLIPDAIDFINNICNIFNGQFYIGFLSAIVNSINGAIGLLETVLFIILGIKALTQGTIHIPVIDSLINKYMD